MAHVKTSKVQLRKKLKKYLNDFIKQNTFTLEELQKLEKNVQPFTLKNQLK